MPLSDREYIRGEHPPNCTCVDCANKRLGIRPNDSNKHSHQNDLPITNKKCPVCKSRLYYDLEIQAWKCKLCKHVYTYNELHNKIIQKEQEQLDVQQEENVSIPNQSTPIVEAESTPIDKPSITNNQQQQNKPNKPIPKWMFSLLLVFATAILGLGISIFSKTSIPFWLLIVVSIIYSAEKWFFYLLRKNKVIGKIYRLLLNVFILSVIGILIWTGITLFSKSIPSGPIIGSLIFIGELALFIWIWKIVAKNSWRWPSMKLTILSLIVLFLILSFAGVTPFSNYKDIAFSRIGSFFTQLNQNSSQNNNSNSNYSFLNDKTNTTITQPKPSLSLTSTTYMPMSTTVTTPAITTKKDAIDSRTGIYKDYYLGLVKDNQGTLGGNSCYGDQFILLINNKNSKNPTYAQLLEFLKSDDTDKYPYDYVPFAGHMYYGKPEDQINLEYVKNIINGVAAPESPHVCADFAERLHNNAEIAGIRCAYVSLDMMGYSDPLKLGIASDAGHACNAFETTDKGLVYIDCTGTSETNGPPNVDTIVVIQVGKDYNPKYLFSSGGWYIPEGLMGKVTGIFMTWDGNWRN